MKQPERMVWIVVVLALCTWSAMSHRQTHNERPGESSAGIQSTRSRQKSSTGVTKDETRRELGTSSTTASSGMEQKSIHALRSSDPLLRLSGFLKVLESTDAGSLEKVTEALAKLKAEGISLPMEEDLLNFRAGQIKGAELMSGHIGSSADFAMMDTLRKQYEGWIQADPQSASRWLNELPTGKYRDQMAISYITASTKDDPVGSFTMVESLHPSQQALAGKAVAERLVESASTEDASAILKTLEAKAGDAKSPYLATMFDSLVMDAERGTDGLALSLIENHLDQPYVTGLTLARVSEERARTNPQAALEWAVSMEGLKNDLPTGEVVASAIRGMTLDGLKSAKNWAATQEENADAWLAVIEKRQELLEEHQGDENEYDKDD